VSVTSIDKNIFLDVGGEPHRHGVIVATGLRVGDWNVSELGIKAVERTLRVVINARRLRERLVNIAGMVVVPAAYVDVADIETMPGWICRSTFKVAWSTL